MVKKIILAALVVLLLAGITSFMTFNRLKVAYIDNYSVYNQFKLKKELEDKLNKTRLARKVILDSLRVKIQMNSIDKINPDKEGFYNKLEQMKQLYFKKEKEYAEENEAQAQKYTDEVWKQLNEYIKLYGTENGYDYIMGANGAGNLMFAKEQHDITKDILKYVNEKYDGK